MPKATPTELISAAQAYTTEHNCPYANDVLRSQEIREAERDQQLGSAARILSKIDILLLDLGVFHKDNQCPPTHIGHKLSPEWRMWVSEVDVAESMINSALGARAHALAS